MSAEAQLEAAQEVIKDERPRLAGQVETSRFGPETNGKKIPKKWNLRKHRFWE